MNSKPKTQPFNPAVLPMEYLPRVTYAFDDKHTRHYLIPGKIFVAAQPAKKLPNNSSSYRV